MPKQINITFTYEETEDSFRPIQTDYSLANHSILAFLIADIIYNETKEKSCFTEHIQDFLNKKVEECAHGSN
ncbi:hypothetical protein [Pseudolactococcus raffinolactis]|uniref:hypothetical protein n=1 Tax=Pseudolactococcus raffinolactis TaxID=1366 RepID=UPI0014368B2F|nr:hypothetical protein [Lactococcus raffinolactis]QIW51165.1 hypothetical protein GU337_04390 [Lactococcus raffinolactis]